MSGGHCETLSNVFDEAKLLTAISTAVRYVYTRLDHSVAQNGVFGLVPNESRNQVRR